MRSPSIITLALALLCSPCPALAAGTLTDGVQLLRASRTSEATETLRRAAGLGAATTAARLPRAVVTTPVDLHFVFDSDVGLQGFQVEVGYPLAKGGIAGSADGAECTSTGDGIFLVNDRDDGTMVLIQANFVDLTFPVIVTCRFDQNESETLAASDVTVDVVEVVQNGSPGDPADLRVTIAVGELPVCSTGWVRLSVQPGGVLDLGWTGLAHGSPLSTESSVTLPIDCAPGESTCTIDGTGIVDAAAGAPVPISAGGVSACVLNSFRDGVTGTFDCDGGCVDATVPLLSRVFLVVDPAMPCPPCVGDPVPNDGFPGGACEGGTTPGGACDAKGINPRFGTTSNDCLPTGSSVGELDIDLAPLTTGTTSLAAEVDCLSGDFPAGSCHCANQDQPNSCIPDGVCPPSGVCENGPLDGVCDLQPFRPCQPDSGTQDCDDIFPGAGTCIDQPRSCFPSTITRSGACGTEGSVLASVFCSSFTRAAAINTVYGLAGPGAVTAPFRAAAAPRPTATIPGPIDTPVPSVEPTPGPPGCAATPLAGCRRILAPNKAALLFKDSFLGRDELAWRWLGGEATFGTVFGDPTTSTSYAFCAYSGPADETTLVMDSGAHPELCGAKSCWRRTPTGGFVYKNPDGNEHGLTRVELTPGDDGAARIVVKGRAFFLTKPSLPLTLPLTVQLQSSEGQCWEADYDTGDVGRNDERRFHAIARP